MAPVGTTFDHETAVMTLATLTLTVPDHDALKDIEANASDRNTPVTFTATGDGEYSGNGHIALRGNTSRGAIQKSFRITLAPDAAPWRGGRIINLLKHPFDLTRVRNALSFELFRSIPNLVSVRTGWVHLVVNAIDRGLYEWVEDPNATFLAARGLDPNGSLYMARTFSFDPIDDATAADANKMGGIVSSHGNGDLAKLRRMVAAVNDETRPINDVIARHFDRDNYVTWLAANVLSADFDSTSQNFMLFSAPDAERWLFLPWDYDGAWGWDEQPGNPPRPRWRAGLSNWWWVPLHRRFLSEPGNLKDLDARISALVATSFADDRIAETLARHHDIIARFISIEPDINNLPCATAGTPAAVTAWKAEYARIARNVGRAHAEYLATLDRPMPFWLYEPALDATGVTLSWSPAAHLRGRTLSYDVEVNKTEGFDPAAVVLRHTGLPEPRLANATLPRGRHFWRVVARAAPDPGNDWQVAFNNPLPVEVP
jgi:spore coat protein H